MKNFFIVLFFIILSGPAMTQRILTIEEASGMNPAITPLRLNNFQWKGNGDQFAWTDQEMIITGEAGSTTRDTLRPLRSINRSLAGLGKDTLKKIPSLTWTGLLNFWFIAGNTLYAFDLVSGALTVKNSYPPEAENIDVHPGTLNIGYTVKNNLFIAVNGEIYQVTDESDPGIISGQSVHRNEFGIYKGTFWSPSGKYLAYYRKDETRVSDYPLVDITAPVAAVQNIKYPMAGGANEQVTLVVFDPATRQKVMMETGRDTDQYLTSVTWDPGEKYLYVALLNRDQDHLALNKYDVQNGKLVKTLFEESDGKYVEPEHPLYFLQSKPGRFIWFSERDGYQHLYLYDTEGNLQRQLTRGDWVVTGLAGTDPKDTRAIFTATRESPLNEDVYSVELATGKIRLHSVTPGTHSVVPSPGGRYLMDVYSDTTITRDYAITDLKGRVDQFLSQSKDPMDHYHLGKTTIFPITAADSTVLYCRMITPPAFHPGNKYPVIVYVYGGPHSQLVSNSWLGGAGLFLNYLAQQGYIVFTLDNRGSEDRGREFEQAIFRDLGRVESEDQMAGVRYLMSLPYVDTARIGVTGWSYGGFMTIALMLRYPDVFKVGVCGGPVTDWKYYEIMYGERYMDTPQSNPEGYLSSSLINKAANLQGKLLMIHGTQDPTVVWQQSLDMLNSFIKEGKQVDYFVYPGHGHGVGGKDRVHLNRKIAEYFSENL